jgi:hypothetical protein
MPSTYSTIATTTLGSSVTSYTFSSIPSTYTDLFLTVVSNGNTPNINFRFNGDAGTTYCDMNLWGVGSSAIAGKDNNSNVLYGTYSSGNYTQRLNIMNYSNTTTYKNIILRFDDAPSLSIVGLIGGTWRSTSAINSVTVLSGGVGLPVGLTATLYGIKAA